MSEAPERIWAEPYWGDDPNDRFWTDHEWTVMLTKEEASDHCPEWIRHDLHLAALAEKDAEIAEALEEVADYLEDLRMTGMFKVANGEFAIGFAVGALRSRRAALDTGEG